MKKQNKIEVRLDTYLKGNLFKQYRGLLNVSDYEVIADVIDILWMKGLCDERECDKKARKSIEKIVTLWDKEMTNEQ